MSNISLEHTISEAAHGFAMQVVNALKNATLQDLIGLQNESGVPARKGRKPGPDKEVARIPKKARKTRNYPKCAYPRCTKNRFVRGKGFCGDHWRMWLAGKIKSADSYKPARAAISKKAARKKAASKK